MAQYPSTADTARMQPTFLERFARVYEYPYGQSFLPNMDSVKVAATSQADDFERRLLMKRQYRPFHVDCPVTRKYLCYCTKNPHLHEPARITAVKEVEEEPAISKGRKKAAEKAAAKQQSKHIKKHRVVSPVGDKPSVHTASADLTYALDRFYSGLSHIPST